MKLPRLKTTPTRTPLTPAPWAATPADEVAALAAQLDAARGRLELLGGDAAAMLTEVPSEAELAQQRRLAEWRRQELREAERAELSDQLAAAEALRQASKAIRDADIRDAVDARKALAEQRRAETPASTVAELHRYSRATRHGIAAVIAVGMLWSAINVQKNMAPGGMHDPLFWASFLIEGMISGLLTIIALGTAKVRDAAGLRPGKGTRAAEVGLFALTLALNTYPYLRDGHWYEVALHAVAPGMIGAALLVLHSLGADYAEARRIVAEQITGPLQLPELPALHTARRIPSYRTAPDLGQGTTALESSPAQSSTLDPEQPDSAPAPEHSPEPSTPAPFTGSAEHAAEQVPEHGPAALRSTSVDIVPPAPQSIASAERSTPDSDPEQFASLEVADRHGVDDAATVQPAEAVEAVSTGHRAVDPEPSGLSQSVRSTPGFGRTEQRSTLTALRSSHPEQAVAEQVHTAPERSAEHEKSTPAPAANPAEHAAEQVPEQRSTRRRAAEQSSVTEQDLAVAVRAATRSRLPVERIAEVIGRHDATGDNAARIARDLGMGFETADKLLTAVTKIRADRGARVFRLHQG